MNNQATRIIMLVCALVFAVAGIALLIAVDWRIAVAVFLFTWARNICDEVRRMQETA